MAADVSCAQRRVEAARLLDKYPNAHAGPAAQPRRHGRQGPGAHLLDCYGPRATTGDDGGEPAPSRAHVLASGRRHAPDGAQASDGSSSRGCTRRGAAAAARAEQTPGLDGVRRRCWRTCCRSKGGRGVARTSRATRGAGTWSVIADPTADRCGRYPARNAASGGPRGLRRWEAGPWADTTPPWRARERGGQLAGRRPLRRR